MKILIINGPNLNILEKRNHDIYGNLSLAEINKAIKSKYPQAKFTFYQSNHEGKLIDKIQKAERKYRAIIINPGALTHYSIALYDALESFEGLKIEVHLSNTDEREEFRKVDLIKDVCHARFSGKKSKSYYEAVTFALEHFNKKT